MKLIRSTLVCLLALFCCYCCNNSQDCNNTDTQEAACMDSIKNDTSSQSVVNSVNFCNGLTKIYTMKKKDGAVIGEVYVKFVKDSIFSELFVINDGDTLYSIKKNVCLNKNGIVVETLGGDIYGYTFFKKATDWFLIDVLEKNDRYTECQPPAVSWNYDDNIIEIVIP